VGLFDLFKDPVERHLERLYIPSYRMMGMSEPEARSMFKEWLEDAKQEVVRGNRFVAPEKFGSSLIRRASTDTNVADYIKKIKVDGVRDKDII